MGKRKKKSLSPNRSNTSPQLKKGKRNSTPGGLDAAGSSCVNRNHDNIYSLLPVEDEHDGAGQTSGKTASAPRKAPRNGPSTTEHDGGEADGSGPPPRNAKLPPLVVKSVSLDKLKRTMQAINVTADFKLSGMGTKLIIASEKDYNKAKTYLIKAGAEFYTHDVTSEKPFKAVIRGLPDMDTDVILAELRDYYDQHPLAVFPVNRRNRTAKYRDVLYLVHFAKGSTTLGALKSIRSINQVIIKWDRYKGPNRSITQCMRCLNFGHGTRNCHLNPKCNYCSLDHWTEDCELEGACQLKCSNSAGEHHNRQTVYQARGVPENPVTSNDQQPSQSAATKEEEGRYHRPRHVPGTAASSVGSPSTSTTSTFSTSDQRCRWASTRFQVV